MYKTDKSEWTNLMHFMCCPMVPNQTAKKNLILNCTKLINCWHAYMIGKMNMTMETTEYFLIIVFFIIIFFSAEVRTAKHKKQIMQT